VASTRGAWLLLLVPALLLLGAVLVAPALVGLGRSFTSTGPDGRLMFAGLRNYQLLLEDRDARVAFRNGAVYTLLAAPLSVAVGLGLALAIAGARRGRHALRLLFLTPWLASPLAVGLLWRFFLHSRVGLPDYLLGLVGQSVQLSPLSNPALALPVAALVDVWRSSPLAAFLLVPGVLAVPRELREQAALDGAGGLRALWHIWLPWLRPLLGVVLLLRVADVLGAFDTLLTLTHGGPNDATTTPALYSYSHAWIGQDWARGLAAAWLLVALVLLLGAGCLWFVRTGTERP